MGASIGTLLVTFAILVFAEITPKVMGAAHADRLARMLAYLIWPLLRAAYPVVWFVNLFVEGLLWLLRLKPKAGAESSHLSVEELRSLVLESGNFIPQQHRDILLNLFELEQLTVADVMTPRGEIEAIDIGAPIEDIKQQLATSFHTRVAVFENDPANIIGILHQRRLLADAFADQIDHVTLRNRMSEPYFIPAATPIYTQLAVLPRKPPAPGHGGRRIWRDRRPGDAGRHHRGTGGKVHHAAIRRRRHHRLERVRYGSG
jgi:Mg2+/Co2+ transporter CorB